MAVNLTDSYKDFINSRDFFFFFFFFFFFLYIYIYKGCLHGLLTVSMTLQEWVSVMHYFPSLLPKLLDFTAQVRQNAKETGNFREDVARLLVKLNFAEYERETLQGYSKIKHQGKCECLFLSFFLFLSLSGMLSPFSPSYSKIKHQGKSESLSLSFYLFLSLSLACFLPFLLPPCLYFAWFIEVKVMSLYGVLKIQAL